MAFVLVGCTSSAPADTMSPIAGAIAACLTAGQEQFDLPLDEASGADVSVEVDQQGWWAVNAATHSDGATRTLACTAVPDSGRLGARAASFSVSEG
jgi:flagellar basal body rod protein FlgF